MSNSELVKNVSELVKETAKAVAKSVMPAVKDTLITTGKDIGKDILNETAQAALSEGVNYLHSKNSKVANITGQVLKNVGEKHLGPLYQGDSSSLGQIRYAQLEENDRNLSYLQKVEQELKKTQSLKLK